MTGSNGGRVGEYGYHIGAYQVSRRSADGVLHCGSGPRREGVAAGY